MSLHSDKADGIVSLYHHLVSPPKYSARTTLQMQSKNRRRTYIPRAMNIRTTRPIGLITDIRRRKAIRIRARMIPTGIPTTIACRRADIPTDNPPHISRQTGIHIIIIHTDFPRRRIPRHILIHKRQDVLPCGLVLRVHVRRTEQTALFPGVEVELQCVFGRVFGVREHAQGFEDGDHAGAVVVCAGPARGGGAAGGVEVTAYDDEVGTGAGDAGDDAGLGEGVRELGHGDGGVGGGEGFDGVEEPGAGLGAVGGAVVAVVEAMSRGAHEVSHSVRRYERIWVVFLTW